MNVNHSELIDVKKVRSYDIKHDILRFGYTMTSHCTTTEKNLE